MSRLSRSNSRRRRRTADVFGAVATICCGCRASQVRGHVRGDARQASTCSIQNLRTVRPRSKACRLAAIGCEKSVQLKSSPSPARAPSRSILKMRGSIGCVPFCPRTRRKWRQVYAMFSGNERQRALQIVHAVRAVRARPGCAPVRLCRRREPRRALRSRPHRRLPAVNGKRRLLQSRQSLVGIDAERGVRSRAYRNVVRLKACSSLIESAMVCYFGSAP
jgi:hypothetical protein